MAFDDLMREFAELVGRSLARRWLGRGDPAPPPGEGAGRDNGAGGAEGSDLAPHPAYRDPDPRPAAASEEGDSRRP